MPIKLFDRVKQKTTTAGSGNVTLTSSVNAFVDFSGVYTDNDQLYYTIENLTDFEVGIGTYSGNTVSRDTVLKSSNSDNLLNLPGDANTFIFATYPASGAVHTTGDRIVYNVDGVDFNLTDAPAYKEGRIFYDNEAKALAVYNDEADITLQLGQEEYLRVRNNTSNVIANGEAVFITGSQGTWPEVAPAIASNEPQSHVIGLATHEIGVSSFGYVTTYGIVRDVDTSDFSDGDEVYLSPEISGGLTGVSPIAPNYKSAVGHVIRSHPNNGTILVVIEPPKLGGGDVKSLGNFQESGIAFIDLVAGSDAAIISSNTGLSYDSGNQILQVDAGGVRFPDGLTQKNAWPAAVVEDATTSITLSCSSHANKHLRTTSASAVTITIPSGLGCDANSIFTFEQAGAGGVGISGAPGVTLNSFNSATGIEGQYAVAHLKQVATNTYTLYGDIA